jgi:hypothetical protein
LQIRLGMTVRLSRMTRAAAVLASAFIVGGASAEVAVRTHAAVEQVRKDREAASVGELVALKLTTSDGEIVAQPRLIAPAGKPTRMVLHPPGRPDEILMSFRVEAKRQAGGLIALHYELTLPNRAVNTAGSLRLSPGVKQAIPLPQGELVATLVAVPFPSDAFDRYLEGERADQS